MKNGKHHKNNDNRNRQNSDFINPIAWLKLYRNLAILSAIGFKKGGREK